MEILYHAQKARQLLPAAWTARLRRRHPNPNQLSHRPQHDFFLHVMAGSLHNRRSAVNSSPGPETAVTLRWCHLVEGKDWMRPLCGVQRVRDMLATEQVCGSQCHTDLRR